ncbi:MAG: hypothetical protein ABIP89_25485 [Polyangiaceae bacterium]
MRVSSFLSAFVVPFTLIACATAVLPEDLGNGGGDGGGVVSGGDSGSGGGNDTGSSSMDSGTGDDTGAMMGLDTGVVPDTGTVVPDSGGGGTVTDNCVGPTSTQLMNMDGTPEAYDDACDAYFMNVGTSNPCGPTGTSCAAFNGTSGFTAFCCYRAPSGSACRLDYGTTYQCIPK